MPVAHEVFPAACPSRVVLDHVTSKWGILVLVALADGPQRWSELRRRAEGISEKMLAQTLRTLEADGFVHRDAQPVIPPRVDYSLTPRGDERVAHLLEAELRPRYLELAPELASNKGSDGAFADDEGEDPAE